MSESDVFLLQLEVETAAARNADLSKQLERLTDELTCSSVHRVEKAELISEGTQTECHASRDVALDLDDLLFEMAEMMFRLYPSTPIDLSSRRGNAMKNLKQLSQRCLQEMHALRTAWETKVEGYNKFIDDLQKALGEYYRSIDLMEARLRKQETDCAFHLKENEKLSSQCVNYEERLKSTEDLVQTITEDRAHLTQRVTDLETERRHLLYREKVLTQTVASLRAVIGLGPLETVPSSSKFTESPFLQKTTSNLAKETFEVVHTPTMLPRSSASPCGQTNRTESLCSASARDMLWACQGSAISRAFPEFCVPPGKVVDFCCKIRSNQPGD